MEKSLCSLWEVRKPVDPSSKVHIKLRAVGGTKTKSPGPGNHSAALTAARELARVGELNLPFFPKAV